MEKLAQGKAYNLRRTITGEVLFVQPVRYVMPQEFKKVEAGIWETFFSELNENVIYRVRIPQRRITTITDDSVFSYGGLVKHVVWKNPELAYTPMVETWLKEVEKIRRSMK